eukprot:CAMPEP_0170803104 /NCGR_PEP_ID=MMETSP0733-20121128/29775_1 /TAXON_ID=186038 /ORGANISM="Fragilariopsis kerguelensis, Strain L26-C5" /LENGTH=124 /DNA_ID=CAMNT_0011156629 /DNA_START=141 /DNA_END=515 /DNA_ORIENTATION=+
MVKKCGFKRSNCCCCCWLLIFFLGEEVWGVDVNAAIHVVFFLLVELELDNCRCCFGDVDAVRGEMVCEKSLSGVLKALSLPVIEAASFEDFIRFANGGGVVADTDAAADADGAADTAEAEVEVE